MNKIRIYPRQSKVRKIRPLQFLDSRLLNPCLSSFKGTVDEICLFICFLRTQNMEIFSVRKLINYRLWVPLKTEIADFRNKC